MKNIFKLMGIALMASSMLFVACSDDDETPDGMTVKFGGSSWEPATIECAFNGDQVVLLASQNEGAFDQFLAAFKYTKEKKYKAKMQEDVENLELLGYDNENVTSVQYYTKEVGNGYGDWWGKEVTIDIDDLDADNLKITATVSGTMFNYEEWVNDETGEATIEDVASKSINVTLKNVALLATAAE